MSSEAQPLQEETRSQGFFLVHIKLVARVWGVLTLAVLWISTVVVIEKERDKYVGWYLIPVSVFVTFFEITWVLNKSACCVQEGCCCRIWSLIMWVDNWKKFILYGALSVPLFLEGLSVALGIVSGFMLILLGTLYLIKTFYGQVSVRYSKTEKRMISTRAPDVRMITHEIATQTEHRNYVTATFSTETESGTPWVTEPQDTQQMH